MRKAGISSIQIRDYRVEPFPLPISMERRSRVRFPLNLKVSFRAPGGSYPLAGNGSVADISSGGVLIACDREISVGTRIELSVEWPVLLDGRVPLQLAAVGTVIRSEVVRFAVELEQYYFRTAGGRDLGMAESCGDARKKMPGRAARVSETRGLAGLIDRPSGRISG